MYDKIKSIEQIIANMERELNELKKALSTNTVLSNASEWSNKIPCSNGGSNQILCTNDAFNQIPCTNGGPCYELKKRGLLKSDCD